MRSVNQFDLVHSFIERCEHNAPIEILVAAFRDTVERLGFRYFACCTQGTDPFDPPREAIMVHNYPDSWARVYSEARLYEIDPVLQHAQHNPCRFSGTIRHYLYARIHRTHPGIAWLLRSRTRSSASASNASVPFRSGHLPTVDTSRAASSTRYPAISIRSMRLLRKCHAARRWSTWAR